MDIVSVNLSRGDAVLLLRVVEGQLAGCACAIEPGSPRCERCEALAAIQCDLGQLLVPRRRPRRRGSPLGLPAVSAATAEPAGSGAGWPGAPPVVC